MSKDMGKTPDNKLFLLTGLEPDTLADVLDQNPRAYMALKGAVAEKHLELLLTDAVGDRTITSFRQGSGDFQKDFYVRVPRVKRELAIECKNIQVINVSTIISMRAYLSFLRDYNPVSYPIPGDPDLDNASGAELDAMIKSLPAHVRESGIERYQFSEMLSGVSGLELQKVDTEIYLRRFDGFPLSIDFQRTRNSRDGTGSNSKMNRFYRTDEIDVVAACLFSRTLRWEFVFCAARFLPRHPSFSDRFSNALRLDPAVWSSDLGAVLAKAAKRK